MFGVLRNRDYRLIAAGQLLSSLGDWPVAGVFADRWDRRRTMVACDLLRAVAVASMLLVRDPGQVWILYLALIAEAAVGQFFHPAATSPSPRCSGRRSQVCASPVSRAASPRFAWVRTSVRDRPRIYRRGGGIFDNTDQ